MSSTEDSRPTKRCTSSRLVSSAGPDSLSGQEAPYSQDHHAAEGQNSRSAKRSTVPKGSLSTGPDSLNGQIEGDSHPSAAVEGQNSPQANYRPMPMVAAPAGSKTSRSHGTDSTHSGVAAADRSLDGPGEADNQPTLAAEGSSFPQANRPSASMLVTPAGSTAAAPPAKPASVPMVGVLEGRETSRSHTGSDAHHKPAAADDIPGGHIGFGTHHADAAGERAPVPATLAPVTTPLAPVREHVPPAAMSETASISDSLLADPLLALAADVLDDLEKVRIANENRLRQLTRSEEDADGETRGFGLDLSHPAVARVAAMVRAMKCDSTVVVELTGEKTPKGKNCCLEHDAEKNLAKHLREHPLGPWIAAQNGIGPKQGARLLAAIGDPYIRPEITREEKRGDETVEMVEAPRPRTVSELWAFSGLKPGQKRRRGERSNWSATAKMRAWNIAGSMLKAGNRETYDKRKAATQGRVHAEECVRCGPSGKPAPAGTPWSDAHRHADALRIVSKEVLKELWREAKRIHDASASGQTILDAQSTPAAGGAELPSAKGLPAPIECTPTASSARPEGAAEGFAA